MPRKQLYIIIGLATGLLLILVATILSVNASNNSGLHLTSTRPDQNKVASTYTNIIFTYNKPISPDTAKNFTIKPKVSGKTEVKNNQLIFTPDKPLDLNARYTATVSKATSADSSLSTGSKSVTFTADNVPESDMPDDIRRKYLAQVDTEEAKHSQATNRDFQGTDALVDEGVSQAQIDALDHAFYLYAPSIKQVIIDPASINPAPHDPNGYMDTIRFNVKVGPTPYKARINYANLTAVRLFLYDAGGKQIYDSNTIDVTNDPSETDLSDNQSD